MKASDNDMSAGALRRAADAHIVVTALTLECPCPCHHPEAAATVVSRVALALLDLHEGTPVPTRAAYPRPRAHSAPCGTLDADVHVAPSDRALQTSVPSPERLPARPVTPKATHLARVHRVGPAAEEVPPPTLMRQRRFCLVTPPFRALRHLPSLIDGGIGLHHRSALAARARWAKRLALLEPAELVVVRRRHTAPRRGGWGRRAGLTLLSHILRAASEPRDAMESYTSCTTKATLSLPHTGYLAVYVVNYTTIFVLLWLILNFRYVASSLGKSVSVLANSSTGPSTRSMNPRSVATVAPVFGLCPSTLRRTLASTVP